MKKHSSLLAASLLLSLPLTAPWAAAQEAKPAEPPKPEQPAPSEPKKEEPKPAPEAPKQEEKKPEAKPAEPDAKKEEPKKEEAKKEPAAQEKFGRETAEILKSWEPALAEVRRATVQLTREGKPIAFGCAVHENGYLITKASEVEDKKGAFLSGIEVRFPEGLRMPVRLVDVHRPYDLALLKVEARGLRPMPWDESANPPPGSFLAAATPERLPVAAGVLSVNPRNLDESQKGWLGVGLGAGDGGVKVTEVSPGSPAAKAGIVSDDLIKSINGKAVANIEEFINTISSARPYQTVKIIVKREKGDRELDATLAPRPQNLGALAEDPRNMMSGTLSKTRRGFPDAFQHDMVLEPNEIGGPVVDLDGHVVGMNIARSGRIECFAIPAKTVKSLVSTAGEGKFFHPELDALREERKNAEASLERLKKDLDKLSQRIKDAEAPAAK